MQDFKKLRAWEAGRRLALRVYLATQEYPKDERYGLTSQMRRAAVSICTNIAEGCGRGGQRELMTFLRYSFASACELECHIVLSADLRYLNRETYLDLTSSLVNVKRMLSGLIHKVRV